MLQPLYKFIFWFVFWWCHDMVDWMQIFTKYSIKGAKLLFSELKLTRYINKNWYIDTPVSSLQNDIDMTLLSEVIKWRHYDIIEWSQ